MGHIRDLTKEKFGKLTPIISILNNNRTYWECICDCGNTVTLRGDYLISGNGTSCGCSKKTIKHNLWKSEEYKSWQSMRTRCSGRYLDKRKCYFDKGIRVCEEWQNDFLSFYNDMGQKPSQKHTIDRIDNSKGYYKGNCRWATPSEQARNRDNNIMITYEGRTMSIVEWAENINIERHILLRVLKYAIPKTS